MQAKGLMAALLKLKVALHQASSFEEINVRTFVGVFDVQKITSARQTSYQLWQEDVLHGGLKYAIKSKYTKAVGVVKIAQDKEVPVFVRQFHQTVVDTIRKFAEKLR